MKKQRLSIVIAAVLLILPLCALLLHNEDSNTLNFKYLSWKLGLGAYDPTYVNHVISDRGFRLRLEGKPLDKVRHYFPDLRLPQNTNAYQRNYTARIQHKDYYWIGDSGLITVVNNGNVQTIELWKG